MTVYEATKIKYFTIEQANRFLKALDLKYVFNYSEHSRVSPNGKKHTVKAYKEVKTIPSQLKLFFYMALLGGFRRGELIALTWDKINFENNTVTIDRAMQIIRFMTKLLKQREVNELYPCLILLWNY